MALFKNKYRIESTRLRNYDYSQPGAYFITIVTHNRQCLFGEINNGKMFLNGRGKIAKQCWLEIPHHFPHVSLDKFVIMPNHVHGIIIITESINDFVETKNFSSLQNERNVQNKNPRGTSRTIGSVVRGFKIGVTKWFRQNTDIHTVWQRNYYEHIVRNNDELNRIRQYIMENPSKWANDANHMYS